MWFPTLLLETVRWSPSQGGHNQSWHCCQPFTERTSEFKVGARSAKTPTACVYHCWRMKTGFRSKPKVAISNKDRQIQQLPDEAIIRGPAAIGTNIWTSEFGSWTIIGKWEVTADVGKYVEGSVGRQCCPNWYLSKCYSQSFAHSDGKGSTAHCTTRYQPDRSYQPLRMSTGRWMHVRLLHYLHQKLNALQKSCSFIAHSSRT